MTNSNSESGEHFSLPSLPSQQQLSSSLSSSLQEFNSIFPTEEASTEGVKIIIKNAGLLYCHHCGEDDLEERYSARVLKCLNCGKLTWFTSGTFFHRAKRIRARLAALWLMERGLIIASSKLNKLVNIAQSSAFHILKRIAIVIEDQMLKQEDICEIPSSVFIDIICKRSRETPARAHPIAEQEEMDALEQEKDKSISNISASISNTSLQDEPPKEETKQDEASDTSLETSNEQSSNEGDCVYNQLSQEEKTIYDLLSEIPLGYEEIHSRSGLSVANVNVALIMLELGGLASRLPLDRYVRCSQDKKSNNTSGILENMSDELLARAKAIAQLARNLMCQGFHGISRKYLQLYLSICWYHNNTNFRQQEPLLNICLRFRSVKWSEIMNYVTPAIVQYN